MSERVSERLKELYKANGNKMVVTTLRGKQHEIFLSKDNKYFYSYTALNKGKIELKLSWFDGIVDFIKENGGRVKKGGCRNDKVGYGKCTDDTLAYYVATECFRKFDGESSYDPIFVISSILDTAGICKNEFGYISAKGE